MSFPKPFAAWIKKAGLGLLVLGTIACAIHFLTLNSTVIKEIPELRLAVRYTKSLLTDPALDLVREDGRRLDRVKLPGTVRRKDINVYYVSVGSESIVYFTGAGDGLWKKELWEK